MRRLLLRDDLPGTVRGPESKFSVRGAFMRPQPNLAVNGSVEKCASAVLKNEPEPPEAEQQAAICDSLGRPRLRALEGGGAFVAAPVSTHRKESVGPAAAVPVLPARPFYALNLADAVGEALFTGLAVAMASQVVGAAYVEGVTPASPAIKVKGAEFAAAALTRDGHLVGAWGRLCVGRGAAHDAAALMPSLVVMGPGDNRTGVEFDLTAVRSDCEPALIELLRCQGAPDRTNVIVAVGGSHAQADLSIRLNQLDRRAIARAALLPGSARRTLLELASSLEAYG